MSESTEDLRCDIRLRVVSRKIGEPANVRHRGLRPRSEAVEGGGAGATLTVRPSTSFRDGPFFRHSGRQIQTLNVLHDRDQNNAAHTHVYANLMLRRLLRGKCLGASFVT